MNDGILLVDKPTGPTSADVVRQVKRRFRPQAIGHLGTLDPMATGLLPLCLGAGTKIARYLAAESKAYEGEIEIGIATDTLDVTGRVIAEGPIVEFDEALLERVSAALTGPQLQRPPMYSAVKVKGKKLYELARAGQTVEREERPIEVSAFDLRPTADPRRIAFSLACSKGTYVRVLAEAVGAGLGTVATLASLRRTVFGRFRVAEAHPLEALLALAPDGPLPLVSPRAALAPMPEIQVDAALAWAIGAGQQAALRGLAAPTEPTGQAAVIGPGGELLAVLGVKAGEFAFERVLVTREGLLYSEEPACYPSPSR